MKPLNYLTDEDFKNISEIDKLAGTLGTLSEVRFNAKSVKQCMDTILQLAKATPKKNDTFYTIIFEISEIHYDEYTNNYEVRYAYDRKDGEIDYIEEDFIPISTEDYGIIYNILKTKTMPYGLCFICIKERIYADEQLYYRNLLHKESLNNKIINDNKYEYLGKIYGCSIYNKEILKLNAKAFIFSEIISCKIRELKFQYIKSSSFHIIRNTIRKLTFVPLIDEFSIVFRYNKIYNLTLDFRELKKCNYIFSSLVGIFSKPNKNEINKVEIIIDNEFFNRAYSDKRINNSNDLMKTLKDDLTKIINNSKIKVEIKTEEK